jgi:hypothetical protein
MLTSTNHLTNGRLANRLFRYASLFGIAEKQRANLYLPYDKEFDCFEGVFNWGDIKDGVEKKEPHFHHVENFGFSFHQTSIDLKGYFQSEKYWIDYKEDVKKNLTFKHEFKRNVTKGYDFSKDTIAIHIRRGDYVNNPNYAQLPITYFILALFSIPDWQEKNIIIFSDDTDYCKVHFQCLPNVRFSEGNTPMEDLCLAAQCDHFILSNSSYSWWQAYLGEKENSIIIRPSEHFAGKLKQQHNVKDFWPERWICFDHEDKKIDLTDVTFTIPVSFDHEDRRENLSLCLRQLEASFDTNIIVGEQDGWHFNTNRGYYNFQSMEAFHRTKMLNDMAKQTDTPIIFNWDADVLIAPLQIWAAVNQLRNGADMVFPYDGRFARMPRTDWYNKLNQANDIGVVGNTKFKGMSEKDAVSVGGAVGFKKASFIAGGMENEHYISYSPEDVSRDYRFRKLGYQVDRVKGCLYHLDHFIGINSNTSNPYFKQGQQELAKEQSMSTEELKAYIQTWAWCRD